jgi:acetyl esterase/lipase
MDYRDGQLLDVYRPASTPAPGIVFVHGGPLPRELGFLPKDWGVYQGYGRLAAASGLVGVTFNHRFHGYGDIETAAADVAAAVDYVRAHAEELGIDPERLAVWAFSGGGPVLTPLLREPPTYLRALVAYYAVLDVRGLPASMAGGASSELLARFSPAAHLAAPLPPVFVARAGLDGPGLNAALDGFVAAALAAGADLTLVNHAAGQHGFDIRDDVPRTREIIGWTLDFLRARLD